MASSDGASQLTSTVHLSQTSKHQTTSDPVECLTLQRTLESRSSVLGVTAIIKLQLEPSDQNQGPPKVRELHEPGGVFKQCITTEKLLLCFVPV